MGVFENYLMILHFFLFVTQPVGIIKTLYVGPVMGKEVTVMVKMIQSLIQKFQDRSPSLWGVFLGCPQTGWV